MSDAFSSINDPLFFLHHGGLDYLWALWQTQDAKHIKAAAKGQLRDVPLWMGIFAPQKSSLEVLDTLDGDEKGFLCYRYEGLAIKDYL
jgi:tyrosinase